jgi:GNAT superfamily N-acetyltransferase
VDDDELGAAADENLAVAWLGLTRAMGGDTRDAEPIAMAATGLPIAFFNGAYLRRPSDEIAGALAEAIRFFGEQRVPWLLWIREGVCPAAIEAARQAGMEHVGGPPAMGLDPIPSLPATPPGLDISIATTEADLEDHARMLHEGFEMPLDMLRRMLQPRLLEDPSMAVLVGRVGGQPVSCSLLAVSGTTAGVYNVATPPAHRGRGYGAALTWAVLEEGARRGCTHGVLQASVAGYPVYRRMGFRDLGRYMQMQLPAEARP